MQDRLMGFRAEACMNNSIFDLQHPLNRDNCFYPYWLMKELFLKRGVDIGTYDLMKEATIVLDMDVPRDFHGNKCSYLLLMETSQVRPVNGRDLTFKNYRKVFTWDDRLVDGDRFVKINFPNLIRVSSSEGFLGRDRLCVLIASNKSLAVYDARDLYVERVKVVRWFEKNAPQDFELYGVGWNLPEAVRGVYGKIKRYLWGFINTFRPTVFFPSYRGAIESKHEVLACSRFSICYENVRDLPGYVTEKIFDCFFSGCVPVYWGASNIADYVPANCFIDRRLFGSMKELYCFLKDMPESVYVGYQQRIAEFLKSDAALFFGADFFAETIVNAIVNDLECEK